LHDQIVGMEEAINLFEGPMRRATQINNPRMKETANA